MGEKNWNAFTGKVERSDREQLIHLGQKLHDQAVLEALALVTGKLNAVLTKCMDHALGSYRLKHN